MSATAPATQHPTEATGPSLAAPASPLPSPAFSAAEKEMFHQQDRKAAGAVILIMSGIFTVAVAAYLYICFWIIGEG